MGFAEDKVKKYIDDKLPRFFRIRVDQIMLRLSCLTEMDKQEIKACVAKQGNNLSVWDFFQRLQSRQGWVTELIVALQEENLGDLAEDVQEVYDLSQPPPRNNALASPNPPARMNISQPDAVASNLSSSDEPTPSLHNVPSSCGAQPLPSLPTDASRAVSATTHPGSHNMGDYRVPVQDTDLLLQNSEMVVKPKATGTARKPESSKSSKRNAALASKPRTAGEEPTDSRATSAPNVPPEPLSGVHLGEMPRGATPCTVPVSSSSDPGSLARKWDGRQQRPVCVKNGYFGNVNRPIDNGVSLAPAAVLSPRISSNQPEEDYYISPDSSQLALSDQDELQAKESLREEKIQALHGYQNEDLLNNPVDAGSPFHLQRRFDKGLEGAPGQRESSGHAGVMDFKEMPKASPAGGAPGNLQSRGLPAAPSNVHSDDLKPPVQEKKRPLSGSDGAAAAPACEEVSETWPPNAAARSTTDSGGNASSALRPSRDDRVFYSNHDDDAPCKPGILISVPGGAEAGSPAQQSRSQETNPEYSGTSSRFRHSEFCEGSDPLFVSDLSQEGQSEKMCPGPAVGTISGRNMPIGAGDTSFLPVHGNHQDDNSIRHYSIHLEEHPSADLTGAPDVPVLGSDPSSRSPGAFPDVATRHQSTRRPTSRPENSEDPHPNEQVDAAAPAATNDYNLLLVGIALATVAVVVFALYKKK